MSIRNHSVAFLLWFETAFLNSRMATVWSLIISNDAFLGTIKFFCYDFSTKTNIWCALSNGKKEILILYSYDLFFKHSLNSSSDWLCVRFFGLAAISCLAASRWTDWGGHAWSVILWECWCSLRLHCIFLFCTGKSRSRNCHLQKCLQGKKNAFTPIMPYGSKSPVLRATLKDILQCKLYLINGYTDVKK